ncbi:MAG: 4Fe-4S binding protein [Armatimonadetes bacterium]|nr:4Fe-4S binding protein [Candidatus Hippobium faecium]
MKILFQKNRRRTDKMVNIDTEKCQGCGACTEQCPVSALEVVDGKVTVSEDCLDCGACTGECPFEALSL